MLYRAYQKPLPQKFIGKFKTENEYEMHGVEEEEEEEACH